VRLNIQPCLAGAQTARGLVMIIDVFRAGNTAAALLNRGAPRVLPVADLDEAKAIKASHPDWLLIGEREGRKPEGFDMNNSPDQAARLNLVNRPTIMTTSAGTRGLLAAAPGADVLVMATLVNAWAAAALARNLQPAYITLVPIGLAAEAPAIEDQVVAKYIAALIQGESPDYRLTARAMLRGRGADRLRRLGQWRDLAYCLRLDRLAFVPKAEMEKGRLVLRSHYP